MNDITTEQLGTSEWLTDIDIRKLEEMYKCKSKPKEGMNLSTICIIIIINWNILIVRNDKFKCRVN